MKPECNLWEINNFLKNEIESELHRMWVWNPPKDKLTNFMNISRTRITQYFSHLYFFLSFFSLSARSLSLSVIFVENYFSAI